MNYYTKRRKRKIKLYLPIIITIFILFNLIFYFFDSRILPGVIQISESMLKAKAVDTISQTSVDLFDEEFNYDEMVLIEKDSEGTINLIRTNTVKLNALTSKLSLRCNEELQAMGSVGVKVPLGWATDQSLFYNLGPKITVKMEPIGNIQTSYESKFESAGINQTRHKIYLNVDVTIRAMLPLHSQEIQVSCQIPISETIIVGKIPSTAIDFGANGK